MESEFNISDFEGLEKSWNKKSFDFYFHKEGFGNMFGGSSHGYFGVIHGENSVYATGFVEILGTYTYSYNIERGSNGLNSSVVTATHNNGEMLGKVQTTHVCGADDALFKLLDFRKLSLTDIKR